MADINATPVNVEDLAEYVVVGVGKDGRHLQLASKNMTTARVTELLAHAQLNVVMWMTRSAVLEALAEHDSAQS